MFRNHFLFGLRQQTIFDAQVAATEAEKIAAVRAAQADKFAAVEAATAEKLSAQRAAAQKVAASEAEKLADTTAPTRRQYITRAEVARLGPTPECETCNSGGGVHPPWCRERFERLWAEEEQQRVASRPVAPRVVAAPKIPQPPVPGHPMPNVDEPAADESAAADAPGEAPPGGEVPMEGTEDPAAAPAGLLF